ncbi:hypothetical protein D3C73_1613370 [compost metagenome]
MLSRFGVAAGLAVGLPLAEPASVVALTPQDDQPQGQDADQGDDPEQLLSVEGLAEQGHGRVSGLWGE